LTAAATLALAWYASPEKVGGYLADHLPRHFATGSPQQAQLPTPPHSLTPAPQALAASTPAAGGVQREPAAATATSAADAASAEAAVTPIVKIVAVQKGDTLMDILLASGVVRADAVEAIDALDGVFRPRDLKPGQQITLGFDPFGHHPVEQGTLQLASLSLQPSVERDVNINRNDSGGFVAQAIDRPLALRLALADGAIESSLFEAGQDAAIPSTSCRRRSRPSATTSTSSARSSPATASKSSMSGTRMSGVSWRGPAVLYAPLIQGGVAKEIYRFTPQDGTADCYNAKGENVRKGTIAHAARCRPHHVDVRHAQASDPRLQQDAQGRRFCGDDGHAHLRCRRRRN
jgi:hypothetical protein